MDPLQDEENSSKRPRHDGSVEENDGSVLLTPKNAPPETNIIVGH